jgi:hypothetical protein
MIDYLDIGPTPSAETCQQVGARDYDHEIARLECRAYVSLLTRFAEAECARRGYHFGDTTCSLRIRSHAHEFGAYLEVAVRYDEDHEEATDLAYWIEANAPETWDDEARAYLDRMISELRDRRFGCDPVALGF